MFFKSVPVFSLPFLSTWFFRCLCCLQDFLLLILNLDATRRRFWSLSLLSLSYLFSLFLSFSVIPHSVSPYVSLSLFLSKCWCFYHKNASNSPPYFNSYLFITSNAKYLALTVDSLSLSLSLSSSSYLILLVSAFLPFLSINFCLLRRF